LKFDTWLQERWGYPMLIGNMRISSDGERQSTAIQLDALVAADTYERHLFHDKAEYVRI
jgi:hypothetical protein